MLYTTATPCHLVTNLDRGIDAEIIAKLRDNDIFELCPQNDCGNIRIIEASCVNDTSHYNLQLSLTFDRYESRCVSVKNVLNQADIHVGDL